MMKLVVIEPIGIEKSRIENVLKEVVPHCEIIIYTDRAEGEELLKRGLDADWILLANQKIPPETYDAWQKLTHLFVAFTGLDHIPLKNLQNRGVTIEHASGYSDIAVAEHVIALVLAYFRHIPLNDQRTRTGGIETMPGYEIAGKTVGIIGLGRIGKRTAQLFRAFGARVIFFNRSPKILDGCEAVSLDQLLCESDIISIHLSLNEGTRDFIGKAEISKMKSSCVLVNCARGAIVNETILTDALRDGKIRAALLDVFLDEPPIQDRKLLTFCDTILTPHIAFFTKEALERRFQILVQKMRSHERYIYKCMKM